MSSKKRSCQAYRFRAMGSPCVLYVYSESRSKATKVSKLAVAQIERLERKYSRYRADSITSRINDSAGDPRGIRVDSQTASLLDYAATAYIQSGGLFDITSGILRKAWNFKEKRIPTDDQLSSLLQLVGWHRAKWNSPNLVLPLAGMEIDFGGYVKEYVADRVAQFLRDQGVKSGLVDLGGDLCIVGPHPDGSPWRVGVRDPRDTERAIAYVDLSHGAIASSGDYERYMIVEGKRYGHILDPRTGRPVDGLASVSAVAPHCLVAGTAATIAMLKGRVEGPRWLDELGLPSLRIDSQGGMSGDLVSDFHLGQGVTSPGVSVSV